MDRGGSPGSRTTPPRSPPPVICRFLPPFGAASGWNMCRSAIPGTSRLVLEDVSLELPAGAVVAIVGENGAGKTTLVKLLSKMYEPTAGSILLDDTPLARITASEWRERLAGAFQDFFRFEFRAQLALLLVGLGDVVRIDDEPAVVSAVDRAGAGDVVARLGSGLETQLGPTWPGGVELSFGQWQKLALARGFMRDEPPVAHPWMSRPRRSMRRQNMRCSNGTQPRRMERVRTARAGGSRSWFLTGSRRCGWPI